MALALLLLHFWLCHPALLYGIAFMLGISCYLACSLWQVIPCLCLWLPFLLIAANPRHRDFLKPLALSFISFFTAWTYTAAYSTFPDLPSAGSTGTAYVKIKNISIQRNCFGKRWLYRCELEQFIPELASHSIASSLPCLISLPVKEELHGRPLANQDYWVSGKLMQTATGVYLLKVCCRTPWIAIPGTWSWAEQRYQWKEKVSTWIEAQFFSSLSASFLAGLVTGKFDDSGMQQQFARFGLQHLLAISGFHFAIIASFLSLTLRLFLPTRLCTFLLLLCLGIYCFFLGPQPSILRAWTMCSLTLLGGLLKKQSSALNSLGLALLMILGYHPLLCQELGFQFSFATTAAILLFYAPIQIWLSHLFPKRHLSEVLQMNSWNQHAYCLLAFLRQGLALTLAVNLVALPMTLYYFQQFPYLSLLYNLFFPLLASGSLCLLLLGGLFSLLPFLAHLIHRFNDVYTDFLLQFTYQVPAEVDAYLTIDAFPAFWLIFFLCCVTLAGIIWREKSHALQSTEKSFALI